jgi:hypothetical protein
MELFKCQAANSAYCAKCALLHKCPIMNPQLEQLSLFSFLPQLFVQGF